MILDDINPFIRFAEIITLIKYPRQYVLAQDCRLFLCLTDTGSVFIRDEEILLRRNTIIYIPSGTPYMLVTCGDLPTKMLAINFDFTRERLTIQEPLPIVNEQDVPAWQIPAPPDVEGFLKALVCKGYQDVDELLIRIGTEFQTRLPGYHALVSASLKAVLVTLAREASSHGRPALVNTVIEYISANYMNDLTVETLSSELNYHPNYLNRIFKQYIGISIHQYIMDRRTHAAKSLLDTTGLPIEKVASLCGFKTASHFSQSFKRFTGQRPGEYKKGRKPYIV